MIRSLFRLIAVWTSCGALAAFSQGQPPPEPSTQADTTLRKPVIVVPFMPSPTVDGIVDKAEWLSAAQPVPMVSATNAEATDEPAMYWIGYNESSLHLAFRIMRPTYAGEALSKPPPAIYTGDSVEVLIQPPERPGDYDFCVNARGEGAEGLRTASTDRAWRTPWTHGGRSIANGWEGEMSVPFASIGQKAAPAPGSVWRIAVVRIQKTPEAEVAYSSYQKGWRVIEDFAYIRFGAPATPAVRVLAAGPLAPGEVGGEIELVARQQPARVKVNVAVSRSRETVTKVVEWANAGETALKTEKPMGFLELVENLGAKALEKYDHLQQVEQVLDVPANGAMRVPLHVAAPPGNYVFRFTATDAVSGELLGGGALPFRLVPACSIDVHPYLLSAGAFGITIDYPRFEPLAEGAAFSAELLAADGKTVLASVASPADLKRRHTVLKLPVKELFEQTYTVRTVLRDAQGQTLLENSQLQRTPARPEWLGNNIGKVDMVLPPWTPIVADAAGDSAKVVLREYRMGANALPAAIRARGKELLAAPIDLTLAGKSLAWQRQLVSRSDSRVVWRSLARAEHADLQLVTALEYDGMMRCDLTLTPRGAAATLPDLCLAIPYRRDRALFGEVVGGGDLANVKLKDWTDIAEFRPMVWVGDYDTGLYWFAEWARDWQIGRLPVLEKRERGETLAWSVRMFGAEGKTLTAPVTLTFGLMAVPARDTDQALRFVNETKRYVKMGVPRPGPDITDSYLRYPTAGNLPPEEGALAFQTIASITANVRELSTDTSQLLQIGQGKSALTLYLTKAWEKQEKTVLLLARGEFATLERQQPKGDAWKPLAKIGNVVTDNSLWMPIALTWKHDGANVGLTLAYRTPSGKLLSNTASLPWDEWQNLLADGELRFGGRNFLTIDQVTVGKQALGPAEVLHLNQQLPANLEGFTLVDRLDRFRLARGMRLSIPDKIANGPGGVAGGRYEGTGMFLRLVDGISGKALLLPGGPLSLREITESYGLKSMCPIQEQFHTVTNLEGFETAPDPILRHYYRGLAEEAGVETMMYSGLCFHPSSVDLRDFVNDIAAEPRKTIAEGAFEQRKGSELYADYHLWAWKRNFDYYGLSGIQMDNTLSVTPDASPIRGTAYAGPDGKLLPHYPIFSAREHAKRIRWLCHVYRQGSIRLHAGARAWPMVADFTDMCEFGEGWYLGEKFTLHPPEEVWSNKTDGGQYRLGYCQQVRNKPGVYPFGANYFYLYCLLFNTDLRGLGHGYDVGSWFIDPKNPLNNKQLYRRRDKQDKSIQGVFNPYFVQPDVKQVSDPQALWRQLYDDFDLGTARFVGFWDAPAYLRLNLPLLRVSFNYHHGRDVLFVVGNFDPRATAAEITVDLNKLGLAGKKLWAHDAWTDEAYSWRDGTIRLTVPTYEYRLVRLEDRP